MTVPRLHLASSSARRRDILKSLGLEFSAAGVAVDESRQSRETAAAMVVRLARAKASAAAAGHGKHVVLGADTAVVVDDRVFGKPDSKADAVAMLAALSGREHQVLTGVALLVDGTLQTALSVTDVVFRDITRAEADAYWQSGEPADKAGAYAIQGLAGAFAVELRGSYSGVVGLPVFETARLLKVAGIDVLNTGEVPSD